MPQAPTCTSSASKIRRAASTNAGCSTICNSGSPIIRNWQASRLQPSGNSVRSHSGSTSCCRKSIWRMSSAPRGIGDQEEPVALEVGELFVGDVERSVHQHRKNPASIHNCDGATLDVFGGGRIGCDAP